MKGLIKIDKTKVIPATFNPVFKALLTNKECKEYLADLINIVTKIPKKEILNNLVIRNSELMNNNVKEKRKVTDLIVDVLNNRINLEMNKEYYNGLFSKSDAYHHKIAAEQFLSGEDYIEERKIIQINFNVFSKFDERIIIKFKMMDLERNLVESENYEKYHVNLEVIKNKYYNKEKISREEKILLLLMLENKKEIDNLVRGDDTMEKARKVLEDLSEDEELVGVYDKEIVDRKVYNTKIKSAKLEGIRENKKQTALNMIKENIDIEIISKVTGLKITEILKIKN